MSVFDKAADLEMNVEAELERLYKERKELYEEFEKILADPLLKNFKEEVIGTDDEVDEDKFQRYTQLLLDMQDAAGAVVILDRTIILLETGVDVAEMLELDTDMDLPFVEESKNDE